MRASTPELLTGSFHVALTLPPEADDEDLQRARVLLRAFVSAIDFGFFDSDPEHPAQVLPGSARWNRAGSEQSVQFSAHALPQAAFQILQGMATGYTAQFGVPVIAASAHIEGSSENLLTIAAAPLKPLATVPFATEIPPEGPEHKSLRIWLDFLQPVPDDAREKLIEQFSVWDALVLGAFPAGDRPIGDSWAGPSSSAFLLPTRLEHFVEDFESGPGAFDVLLRALLRVHRRMPIELLEIE